MALEAPAPVPQADDIRLRGLSALLGFLTSREPIAFSRVWAAILLSLTGLFMAVIWTGRESLTPVLAGLLHGRNGEIAKERVDDVLERLLSATGGKVAVVWEYQLERYTRSLLAARTADGRAVLKGLDERPITNGANGYTQMLDALLTGEAPCFAIDERAAPDTMLLARTEGVKAFCISGIPPAYGLGLRGTVGLFLPEVPNEHDAAHYRVALRAAAASLMRQ